MRRRRFRWRSALALVALTACGAEFPSGSPRRPIPVRAFSEGLVGARSTRSGGSVALASPLRGRVPIPGGSFTMGSSLDDLRELGALCRNEPLAARCEDDEVKVGLLAEAPAHAVTLSSFAIDRTEVTAGEYARCVAARACPPTSRPVDSGVLPPELPVTFVSWSGAAAYCAWTGGRLPTEAEWEYVARGPEGRRFPWGNVYNPFLCNHGSLARDPMDASDGFAGLAPVGSFPDGATPTGVVDMAGNVAEWVRDYFDVGPRGMGYDSAPQVNPTGPSFGSAHVVRGGSFLDGAIGMRGASRNASASPLPTIGFRCAADVR